MHWTILFVASLLEISWAVGLKYTDGFTRLWPTVFVLAGAVASVMLLSIAARGLPIGTAYAVWTGIGAGGTAVIGMLLFGESAAVGRIVCLLLILAGVVGLKFFAK